MNENFYKLEKKVELLEKELQKIEKLVEKLLFSSRKIESNLLQLKQKLDLLHRIFKKMG